MRPSVLFFFIVALLSAAPAASVNNCAYAKSEFSSSNNGVIHPEFYYSTTGGNTCFACTGQSVDYLVGVRADYAGYNTTYICSTDAAGQNPVTTGFCCWCAFGSGNINTYSEAPANGYTKDALCGTCISGTYGGGNFHATSSNTGCLYSSCISCPQNTYQPEFGMSSCIKCPQSRPFSGYAVSSISDCYALPLGYYSKATAVSNNPSCDNTDKDYIEPAACSTFAQVTTSGLVEDCGSCPAGAFFSNDFSTFTSGGSTTVYRDPTFYGSHLAATCVSKCPAGSAGRHAIIDSTYGSGSYAQVRYVAKPDSSTTSFCAACNPYNGGYNGFYGTDGTCGPCPAQTFANENLATSCKPCPYPWISINDNTGLGAAKTQCRPFSSPLCLCLNTGIVVAVCVSLAAFFFSMLVVFLYCADKPAPPSDADAVPKPEPGDPERKHIDIAGNYRLLLGLLYYIGVPFVDSVTDLAFIIQNQFYNWQLFVAMIAFFVAPSLFFFKTLYDKGAVPKFYLVPMPQWLLYPDYDALYKFTYGFFVLIPFALLNLPTLLPMTFCGCFLYSTKAFAIRPVANTWLHLWTGARFAAAGTPEAEERDRQVLDAAYRPIDKRVLNESLYSHVIFETFPILVIQFFNNQAFGNWNALAIFSVCFSIFNAISGIYRIGYYKLWLGVPLVAIPVDFTIAGIDVIGDALAIDERDVELMSKVGSSGSGSGSGERDGLLGKEMDMVRSRLDALERSVRLLSNASDKRQDDEGSGYDGFSDVDSQAGGHSSAVVARGEKQGGAFDLLSGPMWCSIVGGGQREGKKGNRQREMFVPPPDHVPQTPVDGPPPPRRAGYDSSR